MSRARDDFELEMAALRDSVHHAPAADTDERSRIFRRTVARLIRALEHEMDLLDAAEVAYKALEGVQTAPAAEARQVIWRAIRTGLDRTKAPEEADD